MALSSNSAADYWLTYLSAACGLGGFVGLVAAMLGASEGVAYSLGAAAGVLAFAFVAVAWVRRDRSSQT